MFVLGPVLALVTFLVVPETFERGGEVVTLAHSARAAAALAVWMAVWWLSEAVHISVTALLPLVLLPLFGVSDMREAAVSYAHPIIFLFMGGFILSLSMQKWGLHKRIAMIALRGVGTQPHRLVLGFMVVTAVLSMWVSNTATTLMMLPIALSVLDRFGLVGVNEGDEEGRDEGVSVGARNLAVCLVLGIAYGASIGGLGTPLGSPPNAIALGWLSDNTDISISFAQWMGVGMPVVVLFLPVAWLLLTRVLYPIGDAGFKGKADEVAEAIRTPLGRVNRGEVATAIVFGVAVIAWVSRSVYSELEVGGVKPFASSAGDALIAMAAAIALFVIPASGSPRRFVMDWGTAVKMPWGVLILFGGGLSLAGALAFDPDGIGPTGGQFVSFSGYLAEQLAGLSALPLVLIVGATVMLVIFLTELTSNTATANTLVPILGALCGAAALDIAPTTLIIPAALAATCAFMLPVATPPNAIVYSSGHIRMAQMIKAGLVLNMVGVVLITLLTYWLMPVVFGGG